MSHAVANSIVSKGYKKIGVLGLSYKGELKVSVLSKVIPLVKSLVKKKLKVNEWIVYENLYLKNKTEQEVAKILGYKTSEKNRSPGYKQIKNIKKSIIEKAKEIVSDNINI